MNLTLYKSYFNNRAFERKFIIALCIAAMIRVFLFNAAYPLFNPVDELEHFDTIVKHSRGEIYKRENRDAHLDLWSARMMMLYGSPEYLNETPENFVPLFKRMHTPQFNSALDAVSRAIADERLNHEMNSPPLYYYSAGKWLNIGTMLYSNDGALLYWLRFMNVLVYGLLMWLAYIFCRDMFPGESALRIGVPMILSVFPNDIYFSLNSDVFSALFCLLALYMVLHLYTKQKSILYHAATGLAISGIILVNLTNIPMLILCMGLVAILLYRYIAANQLTQLVHVFCIERWLGCTYFVVDGMEFICSR